MATFSFDRPLKLTPEGTERFLEIASKPVEPDGIKPYSDAERKESEELLKKYRFKGKENTD